MDSQKYGHCTKKRTDRMGREEAYVQNGGRYSVGSGIRIANGLDIYHLRKTMKNWVNKFKDDHCIDQTMG